MGVLLDATGAATTWGVYNAFEQEVGISFTVSQAIDIEALQWYRGGTESASDAPSAIRLWEHLTDTTGTLLVTAASVGDTMTVGWQNCPLPAPYSLVTGKTYVVAAIHPGNTRFAGRYTEAGTWSAVSPFTIPDPPVRRRSQPAGYPQVEGGPSTDGAYFADVFVDLPEIAPLQAQFIG